MMMVVAWFGGGDGLAVGMVGWLGLRHNTQVEPLAPVYVYTHTHTHARAHTGQLIARETDRLGHVPIEDRQ